MSDPSLEQSRTSPEPSLVESDKKLLAERTTTTIHPGASPSPECTEPSCRCYPRCCGRPVFRGRQEALAWCLDVTGRTISVVSIGAFLMPALLDLAFQAAGCPDTSVECNKEVYGIRPSSLLTTVHTIVSVCASPLMPLYGAIVDYTSHRRMLGRCASIVFLMLLFSQIFVSEKSWFPITILQILLFFVFLFQMVAAYSYLPELTDNEQVLNEFTRNFTVTTFCAVVVYIAVIVGVSGGLKIQSDNVLVARIATATSFGVAAVTLFLAWGMLFEERPPLHELPPNQSIWSAGFRKLYHSCTKIWKDYRALKWFYIAIAFCDGAIQSLMTIMITFLTDQLGFESTDIGVAVLIMLLANIPAGCIAARFTRLFNPVKSSMAGTLVLIIVTAVAAGVLKHPGQEVQAYIIVFFWGIGTGWKWTSDRMLCK